MERVAVLINKLQVQLAQNASVQSMLVTVQLLQAQLLQESKQSNGHIVSLVSVMVPNAAKFERPVEVDETIKNYKPVPKPDPVPQPEPDTENEPLPEPAPHPGPRPEPAPIPSMVEVKPWYNSVQIGELGPWPVDAVMEVPTLAHQEKVLYELNDVISENEASLNETLKVEKVEMGSVLQEAPIRDLKKAISINERHRFINELFRGDETMYERSVKTINSYNIYAEAEYWIQRELKLKIGWDVNSEAVKMFDQLVKRRFS
ncbi:MAG: hypothetical protein LH478_00055 [Chitinophagaceae bacterium]|nr:hypothetical protein [Chitinophagaceae bacterium]